MFSLLALILAIPSPLDLATASPDAPTLELGWRDGMRAKGGGRIRLYDDGEDFEGVLFHFDGFIELHNEPGYHGAIPYQFWRGRFALEGGYRWKLEGPSLVVIRLTGALEHESDHPTAANVEGLSYVGYVNLNSVSLTGGLRHGRTAPTHAAITARLHVLTCTRSQGYCGLGGGGYGDRSFELEGSLTQELALWCWFNRWNLFVSVWGQGLVGTPLIAPATRAALRLGAIRHRASDALSIFFQAFGGTDVGYFRQGPALQLGAGVAWSPN